MRYRHIVFALNTLSDISIVQSVWKCQRNERISSADFRPITTQKYTNKKRYLSGYCTKVTKFLDEVAASSLVLITLRRWRYAIRFRTPKQRLKVVIFNVCKKPSPKMIGYHSNDP